MIKPVASAAKQNAIVQVIIQLLGFVGFDDVVRFQFLSCLADCTLIVLPKEFTNPTFSLPIHLTTLDFSRNHIKAPISYPKPQCQPMTESTGKSMETSCRSP